MAEMILSLVVKRIVRVTAYLIVLSLGLLALGLHAGKKSTRAIWQSSTSPHVRIGVRNAFGNHNIGSYTAQFVITGPDGRQYKATRVVKGDDWGYVFFPNDFNAWWGRGNKYTWSCRVHGKVIAQGTFEHEYISPDAERITVQ